MNAAKKDTLPPELRKRLEALKKELGFDQLTDYPLNDDYFMGRYILDDDGTPVSCENLLDWGAWMESGQRMKFAKQTEFEECWLSTVFLGLDHSWVDRQIDNPLIWETMVFEGGGFQKNMISSVAGAGVFVP